MRPQGAGPGESCSREQKADPAELDAGHPVRAGLCALVAAFALAYLLRFEFAVPEKELGNALQQLPYVVLIQFAALALAGVYSFIWRYVGLGEVKAFLYAALWSGLALAAAAPDAAGRVSAGWRVPLSVILMGTVLSFGGVLGLRVLRRYLYEHVSAPHRATLRPADRRARADASRRRGARRRAGRARDRRARAT